MTDASASFWRTLRRRVRLGDCLALAAVPAVLVGVFLLPESTRRAFAFAYRRPTVVTAYTAHFVHFSLDHLLANLLGYVLLAGIGYSLSVLAGARRLFGVAAATYLLAFPFVLSGLNLAIPRNGLGYGFSALNMAFAGLLAILLAVYAERRLHAAAGVRQAPGPFLLGLALVAVVALPPTRTRTALAAAAALAAIGYGASFVRDVRSPVTGGRRPTGDSPGWPDLFALGALLFVGYPFVGFPAEGRLDGAVVNVYLHLLGFCLAFLVPYIALEADVIGTDR